MSSVRIDLLSIKERLEKIDSNLTKQSKQIDEREVKWSKMEENIRKYKINKLQKINLNIGGVKYTTTLETLSNDKENLISQVVFSENFDFNEEIYIERRGDLFSILLDYLRFGEFDYRRYNKQKLLEIKDEADFFNITKIYNEIDELTRDIEIINYEHSGDYIFKGAIAGTQKIDDLKTTDLNTGVCTTEPGWIIFELKGLCEFSEISAGGWNGNTKLWYPGNGSGSKIYVSIDKNEWTLAGTLSGSFATKIVTIKLKQKFSARYIKFENNKYLGFGHLFIKRAELE